VKPSRAVLVIWAAVLIALVLLELAEVTHLFTFPISVVLADPVSLVVSLVFTTIVAMIGAIFIGIYFSTRLLRPRGFSPFEEEVLRMRTELREIRTLLEQERVRPTQPPPAESPRGPLRR
jgi:hypothetical protein